MKRKKYSCDGGAICIGTKESRSDFLNNYGDGTHYVTLYDRSEFDDSDRWEFRGSVRGRNINVYKYDCLLDEECEDKKNILFKISGRIAVFARKHSGEMALVLWEKYT